MPLDGSKLTEQIREAARRAFGEVRAAHPEEVFYAFALYTDSSLMTVMPSANSEEQYARKAATTKSAQTKTYYRWATAEWAFEAKGQEHFGEAYKMLNDPASRYQGDDEAKADEDFHYRTNAVIGSMVEALRQLDAEHFFGQGQAREKVTLFVAVSDDDRSPAIETKSAEMLNPPNVFAEFAKRYG